MSEQHESERDRVQIWPDDLVQVSSPLSSTRIFVVPVWLRRRRFGCVRPARCARSTGRLKTGTLEVSLPIGHSVRPDGIQSALTWCGSGADIVAGKVLRDSARCARSGCRYVGVIVLVGGEGWLCPSLLTATTLNV